MKIINQQAKWLINLRKEVQSFEVNELKEQLYQLKENVKCPKCGAYNHSDDVYCSKCGERIYNVNSDDTDSYDDDEVVIINAKKPETEED